MMNNFFYSLLIILFPIFWGCSNKTTTSNSTSENNSFVEGTITTAYQKDGCDYLIKATVKGTEMIYAAINLDESLKENNKHFQFKFHPIRAPRKGACKKGVYIYIEEFK